MYILYTYALILALPFVSYVATPVPPEVQGVNILRSTSNGSASLTVSWTAVPGSGITYTVWYSTNNGTTTEPPFGALNVSGIIGTSTTLSGLTQGTTYYIWVSAVSSGVPGTYSMRLSETTYSGNVTYICRSFRCATNTIYLLIQKYLQFYIIYVSFTINAF